MPLVGGVPRRRTFDAAEVVFVGWTPDGKILVGTDADTTLPQTRLVTLDISQKNVAAVRKVVPLAQAADGELRRGRQNALLHAPAVPGQPHQALQGRHRPERLEVRRRRRRGRAAHAPTIPGTSKNPMCWQGRVYFLSDRDGAMNLWSMKPDGSDLKQHTQHAGWDVMSASLYDGRIAYQLGADIRLYDIASGEDRVVPITLESDFDQEREHVVSRPLDYLTSAHLSSDGGKVALTARGRVFVAPARTGRFVEVERKEGVRYREAHFLSDKTLVALSDESGEVELWTLPANGVGAAEQLTKDAEVLRWDAVPSPDGKLIAHHDKNLRLFLYDVEKKENKKIDETKSPDGFADLRWSPDGKWLAYVTGGRQPVPPGQGLQRGRRHGHDPDHRPLRQLQPGLEPRRPLALLPLRPQPQIDAWTTRGAPTSRSRSSTRRRRFFRSPLPRGCARRGCPRTRRRRTTSRPTRPTT